VTPSIGQLFFIGLRGPTLTPEEADFIVERDIGGVIYFARNVQSPEQVHALSASIQNLRLRTASKQPFFIGVDQEGGRVARLRAPLTEWPPLAAIGKLDSTSVAFKVATAMAQELRAVGINLDFAPSVDVFTNPLNTVIGDRALSDDPERVAKLASALVRGFIKGGVIPCAKHFPGHGNTLVDSHLGLPVEDADLARLREVELVPFRKVFRARLDLVMTAHIKFPKIDPEYPATLSKIFVQQILRDELKYRGLVITDDLGMGAVAQAYPVAEIPVLALEAGCDLLCYCNEFENFGTAYDSVRAAVQSGRISAARIAKSVERVLELKRDALGDVGPKPFADSAPMIGHPDHRRLSDAVRAGQVPADLLA
jgi:beta-N-acetylhexosaminidase